LISTFVTHTAGGVGLYICSKDLLLQTVEMT